MSLAVVMKDLSFSFERIISSISVLTIIYKILINIQWLSDAVRADVLKVISNLMLGS